MSNDDTRNDDHSEDFETRTKNLLDTIIENQAKFSEDMRNIQQAIVGLIQVARTHDDQIDRNSEQIKELGERVDALIRVVESHVSNHP
ncbi:MAG: hypothetical protein WBV94_05630 [Blastocatellia bacterium]